MPALPALVIGGAGLASAAIQGSAAKSAANQQIKAEQAAQQEMAAQQAITRQDLAPYNRYGQDATIDIHNTPQFQFGAFDFQPTQSWLEQTPGYQFNLSQGLKATQNGYAAQGLGTSGAALKGAASYASGLADTTYQNQFKNALDSYLNNYQTSLGSYTTNLSKLQNLAGLGEDAAAKTGNYGTQTASNIGQSIVGAANAGAAGSVGVAKAATGGLNSLTSAYFANRFYGNQGGIYDTVPSGDSSLAGGGFGGDPGNPTQGGFYKGG